MKRYFALICILLFTLSTTSVAEEVVIFADYKAKPKNWVDAEGNAHGIQYEILNEISERTGIHFTFQFTPWKRGVRMSQRGHGGIIGFSKSQERMKEWDYSEPIYFDELVVISMMHRNVKFIGPSSLNGLRIGIKLGARYGDGFEQAIADKTFTIVESINRNNQLQLLTSGKVDVILMSPGQFALDVMMAEEAWLQKYKYDFVVHKPAYKVDANHIALPKSLQKSHLLPPINRAIKEIMIDGTYERIVVKVTAEAMYSFQ